MADHGTPLSLGQFANLSAAVTKNLPRTLSPAVAEYWTRNGAELAQVLAKALDLSKKELYGRKKSKDSISVLDLTIADDCGPLPEGWEPSQVHIKRAEGKEGIFVTGNQSLAALMNEKIMGRSALWYYLQHPESIPKAWSGYVIFFDGTLYQDRMGFIHTLGRKAENGEWVYTAYLLGSRRSPHCFTACFR